MQPSVREYFSLQVPSQTFLKTEGIAKRRSCEFLRGLWACPLPPPPKKILKSRRSEMPFLVFSWWNFSPNMIKIQTNFNNIYVCCPNFFNGLIQKWNFRNSEMLYQHLWQKKISNSFKVAQLRQFKCAYAEVYSLLKASFLLEKAEAILPWALHGIPSWAIFAAALGRWALSKLKWRLSLNSPRQEKAILTRLEALY